MPTSLKKFIFLAILVSLLALLQSSFFPIFLSNLLFFNFLIIFSLIYLFLEKEKSGEGIFVAGITGFWFDIFSTSFFGLYTLSFLLIAYLIKIIFSKYVGFSFS